MNNSRMKMSDIIKNLDAICYENIGVHYKPIQSLSEYEKIEAPAKAVKTLAELQVFTHMTPKPLISNIAYDIVILSLSEKNFVHELIRSRMPNVDFLEHPAKDLVLAIKSNLYVLFQESLDKLSDPKNSPKAVLEEYFDKRIDVINGALNAPTEFISRFKNEQIQLDEAITFAHVIIKRLGINFDYIPIVPEAMAYYRLPYQPNYKIRTLSEKILQIDANKVSEEERLALLSDAYDYIFELMKTEENIVGFSHPSLETFRKNIYILIDQMVHGVDTNKTLLALKIENLFNLYFHERKSVVEKNGYVRSGDSINVNGR